MKRKKLSNGYISALCLELSLFLNAGITLSDGIHLLIEDDDDISSKEILQEIADIVDQNRPLSDALEQTKLFPDYMIQMVTLGEKTGRTSDILKSLSEYYDRQERLSATIKNALIYPAILLIMMIAVVIVLITVVLPIFDDVFRQLGTEMPAFTAALMNVGQWLQGASLVFVIIAAVIIVFVLLLIILPKFRAKMGRFWRDLRKEKGLAAKISLTRFSSALALTMKAGLNMDESFKMASILSANSKISEQKHSECAKMLDAGHSLTESLTKTNIFPAVYSRMLSLGAKSGSADTVLDEIARRCETTVNESIERILGRIEPTLVIITSLIVGVILLSVMMPLMNIMSSLG